jgi:type VI secretion system protein ImpM
LPGHPLNGRIVRLGFFGKLPSRGDFVRVGISRAVATAWDQWLQSVMPGAQAQLNEGWDDIWQAARSWRFAFGPGVCGPLPVSGLWLPSADKVGRRFPLMIAAEAALMTESLLYEAERIGVEAIRDAAPPELLAYRLGLESRPLPVAPSPGAAATRWWRPGMEEAEILEGDALPDAGLFLWMLNA